MTKKPESYDELFPGRFLKAGLFKGREVTLTVADVAIEEMPSDDGKTEMKGILAWRETPLHLALNRTNGECLKAMFGARVADWIGKRVTLYPTTAKFGKETVDAIRVRGSPDLARDLTFSLKLPRKKARTETLKKTGAAPAAEAAPESPPQS